MQVSTLEGYETVTVAKLRILKNLKPKRKKSKLYFKNRGKAHDTGAITDIYSKFLNSKREISYTVLNIENIYVYVYEY